MQITKESYGNGRWAVLVSIPGVGIPSRFAYAPSRAQRQSFGRWVST
jgi:hypothetical protein